MTTGRINQVTTFLSMPCKRVQSTDSNGHAIHFPSQEFIMLVEDPAAAFGIRSDGCSY